MKTIGSKLGYLITCIVVCSFSLMWLGGLFSNETKQVLSVKDLDLGEIAFGDHRDFSAVLENLSSQAVQIVGAEACCGIKVTTFPPTLPPNATGIIEGKLYAPYEVGAYKKKIVIFANQSNLFAIPFEVRAFAIEP